MYSQTLHKRPADVYSFCDCIGRLCKVHECIGTVYTCMNSWKESFNPIVCWWYRFCLLLVPTLKVCWKCLKFKSRDFSEVNISKSQISDIRMPLYIDMKKQLEREDMASLSCPYMGMKKHQEYIKTQGQILKLVNNFFFLLFLASHSHWWCNRIFVNKTIFSMNKIIHQIDILHIHDSSTRYCGGD